MPLDHATVRTIAQLARIRIPDEDMEGLAGELSTILAWVEQLREVDTEAVAPMTSGTDRVLSLRDDVVTDGGMRDAILANAPEVVDGFFAVPKVVE
ncbi:MAG: Asp-tRNA(Asn)/Glu-tRNA(Gln) amidotransferase subunit GatC [Rhodospirillales bacterium]|nr:MAG: Asp-tRNA(Asn)/Glu-tRNA(Gln) amidotransferase subunit GatC [Rhodospirillales bacterium]